jgi:hypothetical protein
LVLQNRQSLHPRSSAAHRVGWVAIFAFLANIIGVPLHIALEHHEALASQDGVFAVAASESDDSHEPHSADDHQRQIAAVRRVVSPAADLFLAPWPLAVVELSERPVVPYPERPPSWQPTDRPFLEALRGRGPPRA